MAVQLTLRNLCLQMRDVDGRLLRGEHQVGFRLSRRLAVPQLLMSDVLLLAVSDDNLQKKGRS